MTDKAPQPFRLLVTALVPAQSKGDACTQAREALERIGAQWVGATAAEVPAHRLQERCWELMAAEVDGAEP